jgi:hypothetical protein
MAMNEIRLVLAILIAAVVAWPLWLNLYGGDDDE